MDRLPDAELPPCLLCGGPTMPWVVQVGFHMPRCTLCGATGQLVSDEAELLRARVVELEDELVQLQAHNTYFEARLAKTEHPACLHLVGDTMVVCCCGQEVGRRTFEETETQTDVQRFVDGVVRQHRSEGRRVYDLGEHQHAWQSGFDGIDYCRYCNVDRPEGS
jgi:hypothetical protein